MPVALKPFLLSSALLTLSSFSFAMTSANDIGLVALEDGELNEVRGAALFDISQTIDSNGVQFMRFLVNARLELNANIGEVKLGDPANPDIWLQDVTLSGGSGPTSKATLVRPFLEFAMKNYNIPEQRQLIGLRIGAEGGSGVMGVGSQDTSVQCFSQGICSDTGIQALHGYMVTRPAIARFNVGAIDLSGYLQARRDQTVFDFGNYSKVPDPYYYPNEFLTSAEGGGSQNSFEDHFNNNNFWAPVGGDYCFLCNDYNEDHAEAGQIDNTIQAIGNGSNFGSPQGAGDVGFQLKQVLPGVQLTTEIPEITFYTDNGPLDKLTIALADIPYYQFIITDELDENDAPIVDTANATVTMSGAAEAKYVDALLNLNDLDITLVGTINNVRFSAILEEELRFLHRFNLGGSNGNLGLSISLQSEEVHWPDAIAPAHKGYWLSFEEPVDLGADLGVVPQVIYADESSYRQLEVSLERGILTQAYPGLVAGLLTPVPFGDLDIDYSIYQEISTVPIGEAQAPPINCYGGVDCF